MAVKVITIGEDILGANEQKARGNQKRLDQNGILAVNIMSSPGAGKTSLLLRTIDRLKPEVRIAVIEGDVASSIDAERINEAGVAVVQINTAGGCHLDANMIGNALNNLPLENTDLLFIENVGNLICPVEFALGEHRRVLISSLPEGDDKPYKYPAMFADADVVLLNKIDLKSYLNFNIDAFQKTVNGMNPDVKIFPVSCQTGEGLESWFSWLESTLKDKKKTTK
ncbi:MAG: hydrogenase accessory protein HypB [Chloroflexi bacterium RBG_16_50_9]|nr:MAG: hydrogenase accessory protein HypB [Chloroflexi bacterium RBG_16_50_9]